MKSLARPLVPALLFLCACQQNLPPAIATQELATPEDTELRVTVSATDPEGAPLTLSIVEATTHGELTADGLALRYVPEPNFHGEDSLRVAVSDGRSSTETTLVIKVTPVNDAPVAAQDNLAADEDVPAIVSAAALLANDTDVDGDALTVSAVGAAANGTVAMLNGVVTFTPAPNHTGTARFEYTVTDGEATATGTVSLIVGGKNDAPMAGADAVTTDEDTPVAIPAATLLANDSDAEGQMLSITAVGSATPGAVSLNGTVVTFSPAPNFYGTATFSYTVSDGAATSGGQVTVTVAPVNDAPSASNAVVSTPEDTAVTVTLIGADVENSPLTFTLLPASTLHGTLGSVTQVTPTSARVLYTPNANSSEDDVIAFQVSDGAVKSAVATVTVDVVPVNDPPVATAANVLTPEDTPVVLSLAATDPDSAALTFSIVTPPATGTLGAVTQVTPLTATVLYTPALNATADTSLTFRANDGQASSAPVTVLIDVVPVNDAPVAQAQAVEVLEGKPTLLTLTATDVDLPAQALTFAVDAGPGSGTLGALTSTSATTATVLYTPSTLGVDTFSFTASDGLSTSAAAVVTVTVNPFHECANGVLEPTETCDDGDADAGDGCSAQCQTETGWTCTGQPSVCSTVCGDSIVIAGREACDDGNTSDTDGCTTQCKAGPVCAATNSGLTAADRFATDPASGTCYASFDDELTTFSAAQTACVASGGHLATITSSAEQARVATVQNSAQNPWIGATDQAVEGTFSWVRQEPFNYTHFAPGQPDDALGDEDCLHLLGGADVGLWADTNCAATTLVTGRVCELAANTCGDGWRQPTEGCDDGNTTPFDGCSAACQPETLFFSEYVEGSASNKAVELANPLSTPASLAGCSLRLYSNGASAPSATLNLTQTVAPHDVLVFCNPSASAPLLAKCDVQNANVINFNGDDAIELFCNGATVDIVGQVGFRPNIEWGTGLISTSDNTLRRKCSITRGDTVPNNAFDPAAEWGGYAVDTLTDVGAYGCAP